MNSKEADKMPLSMEEVQKVSLEILKIVSHICETHNFRYTLAFGTLIGAIRHKGFIPWDDDIDILMPRPDYEKLIKYIIEHPIENLKVFNWKYTKGYIYGISRVCDMRYRIYEQNNIDCNLGVFIDIYPVDGLANTYSDAKKAFDRSARYRDELFMSVVKKYRDFKWVELFNNPHSALAKIRRRLMGVSYYQKKLENEVTKYNFDDYEYVGVPNWNWARIVFKRDWFNELVKVPFEDSEFYITKYYDDMLKEEYGNYMQLPPESQRVYHHGYLAYIRQ